MIAFCQIVQMIGLFVIINTMVYVGTRRVSKEGMIIEKYDQLVDPKKEISERITSVTNITNEMVKGMPDEEEAVYVLSYIYEEKIKKPNTLSVMCISYIHICACSCW